MINFFKKVGPLFRTIFLLICAVGVLILVSQKDFAIQILSIIPVGGFIFIMVIDNMIKSSDDGEPSKTAGVPILNQITNNDLNYVLIIVVRYFGGVKLGAGPLTRAYAKLARDVIKKENITTLVKGYDINISFNYNDIKNIDYILGNSKIISKDFNDTVTYNVYVNEDVLNKLSNYDITINKDIYIEKE